MLRCVCLSLAMAAPLHALVLVSYSFEGNGLDSSGNGHHLNLFGDATFSTGIQGSALQLDGLGDYAENTTFMPSLTSFTVEAWINVPSYANNVHYVSLYQNNYVVLGDYGAGAVSTWASGLDPVNAGDTILNEPDLTLNEWHHIAFTYDGTYQRIYIDGEQVGADLVTTGTLSESGNFDQGLNIGSRYTDTTQFVSGLIDEVRIHDVALSAAQIASSFANVVPEPSHYIATIMLCLCAVVMLKRRIRQDS